MVAQQERSGCGAGVIIRSSDSIQMVMTGQKKRDNPLLQCCIINTPHQTLPLLYCSQSMCARSLPELKTPIHPSPLTAHSPGCPTSSKRRHVGDTSAIEMHTSDHTFSLSSQMAVSTVSLREGRAHSKAPLAWGRSRKPSLSVSPAANRAFRVALLTDTRLRYWSSRACMRGSAGMVPALASCVYVHDLCE